ncbi:YhbY family RNA-binding protein [Candidatus Harpocratesius sp.]
MNEEFQTTLQNRAHVIIGKNGITPNMLIHITELFKTNKLLKIKILKDIAHTYGVDYFLEYLIQQLGIYILDVRGFTAIISKRAVRDVQIPKKYRIMRIQNLKQEKLNSNSDYQPEKKEKIDQYDENDNEDELEEPEFIDYDDEELLERIDATSDEIYGNASKDVSAQPKSPLNSQIEPEKIQHAIKKPYKKSSPKPSRNGQYQNRSNNKNSHRKNIGKYGGNRSKRAQSRSKKASHSKKRRY